jgi:hypothetical protein
MSARDFSRISQLAGAPDEVLLTPNEVHALYGWAPVTLRLWHRQGRGPRQVRLEGRPRYRLGDLRAWISGSNGTAAA